MARRPRETKPEAVLAAVGLGSMTRGFQRAFDLMRVAEEEIESIALKVKGDPHGALKRVWNSFALLEPGELADLDVVVYRDHCRELLARVASGRIDADTRLGTRAEVCAMISRMTQASRLQHDVDLLGLTFADAIFPGRGLLTEGAKEDYAGSMKVIEKEFRHKLRKPERLLREDLREPPEHFLAKLAS